MNDEKVVSWFEENYKSLIVGVVIGLTILFGYKSYISSQNSTQLELSRQFDLAVISYQKEYKRNFILFKIKYAKQSRQYLYIFGKFIFSKDHVSRK